MADKIRFRVWLLGLGPVVLIVAVLVALFVGSGGKPASHAVAVVDTEPSSGAQPASASSAPYPAQAVSVAAIPQPPSPPPTMPAIVAPAASSVLLQGPPPEPIPELDALARPKGSEQWTVEQKLAYREQALQALDAKERSLQQEVDVARRRGDSQAVQEKQATLDYLRARRAQIDQALGRHDPLRDALEDAGS